MSVDNLAAVGGRDGGEIDVYCTLKRDKHKNKSPKAAAATVATQRPVLTRRLSGSHDDLYTGTRVSKVPEPTEYAVRVSVGYIHEILEAIFYSISSILKALLTPATIWVAIGESIIRC